MHLPVLGLFLPTSTDQDDDSSNGCRGWKCFHPWLPLLVDTCGTIYPTVRRLWLAFLVCFESKMLPNRSNEILLSNYFDFGFGFVVAGISSIDTGLSLIAMLKAGHVH